MWGRELLVGAAVAAALGLGAVPALAQDQPRMGVVAESGGGIPWFNAMAVGIEERARELG